MFLETLRIRGLGPFDDVELGFVDPQGEARPITVIHGDGGTGKSTLVAAIDCTRPGRTVKGALYRAAGAEARVEAAWRLDQEDAQRPHPVWLVTPGQVFGDNELSPAHQEAERLRRREAALFDKQAQGPSGFLVYEFSEHRCFPRASASVSDPARTILRHEIRQPAYGDRSRHELTRRCKQVLAYAELASSLMGDAKLVDAPSGSAGANESSDSGAGQATAPPEGRMDPRRLHQALGPGLDRVLSLVGHSYAGLDPMTFEPLFETPDGRLCHLDEIAKQARHLVAFVVLSAHALWVRSGGLDPRAAVGVILIDEIELSLQPRVAAAVLDALHEALPKAQWITTTSSPLVAASVPASCLLTVRRLPGRRSVQLYTHELAQTH